MLSTLIKPFRFSSKAFLVRILESDKAENLVSLLTELVTTGLVTNVFSSIETGGLAISSVLALSVIGISIFSF